MQHAARLTGYARVCRRPRFPRQRFYVFFEGCDLRRERGATLSARGGGGGDDDDGKCAILPDARLGLCGSWRQLRARVCDRSVCHGPFGSGGGVLLSASHLFTGTRSSSRARRPRPCSPCAPRRARRVSLSLLSTEREREQNGDARERERERERARFGSSAAFQREKKEWNLMSKCTASRRSAPARRSRRAPGVRRSTREIPLCEYL